MKIKIGEIECVNDQDRQEQGEKDIFILQQIIEEEIERQYQDQALQVPEILKGRIDDGHERRFEGKRLFGYVPVSRVEDARINIFYYNEDHEEGKGPDEVGNYEGVEAVL